MSVNTLSRELFARNYSRKQFVRIICVSVKWP